MDVCVAFVWMSTVEHAISIRAADSTYGVLTSQSSQSNKLPITSSAVVTVNPVSPKDGKAEPKDDDEAPSAPLAPTPAPANADAGEPVASASDKAAWMFHLIMFLAALYLAMLISNWGMLTEYVLLCWARVSTCVCQWT